MCVVSTSHSRVFISVPSQLHQRGEEPAAVSAPDQRAQRDAVRGPDPGPRRPHRSGLRAADHGSRRGAEGRAGRREVGGEATCGHTVAPGRDGNSVYTIRDIMSSF